MQSRGMHVLGPSDGRVGALGSMGVRFMLAGGETGGGFSLVEHPIPPLALAAPLHRHSREDEYSFVLEGRLGALLGDEVVHGEAGDLIFKPRGQWHTFWNARDEPARILEIISPAGFERYFEQMVELLERPQVLLIRASSPSSRRSMDSRWTARAFRASPRNTACAGGRPRSSSARKITARATKWRRDRRMAPACGNRSTTSFIGRRSRRRRSK